MNVWTTNDFEGHWPVGSAAIVLADSEDEARAALALELIACGLEKAAARGFTLRQVDLSRKNATILADGSY